MKKKIKYEKQEPYNIVNGEKVPNLDAKNEMGTPYFNEKGEINLSAIFYDPPGYIIEQEKLKNQIKKENRNLAIFEGINRMCIAALGAGTFVAFTMSPIVGLGIVLTSAGGFAISGASYNKTLDKIEAREKNEKKKREDNIKSINRIPTRDEHYME